MKIAIVSDQFPPMRGGVAAALKLLLEGLSARGHEVRVFAPDLPGSFPDPRVVRMPTMTFAQGTGNIASPFGISKRLSEFGPDVVHLHTVGLLVVAGLVAAKRLRIPCIITYHGDMSDYLHLVGLDYAWIRTIVDWVCARFFNAASIVTAPSRRALVKLRSHGVTRPRMEYVPNPIDVSRFQPHNKERAKSTFGLRGRKTLGIFGRISREKNLEDAVAAIKKARGDFDVLMIGDGPYRAPFESLVRERALESRVHMPGFLSGDALVGAINACDAMLSTGLAEVQPLAILQSLACGVPVIGTNAGGTPECIHDGETGFVLEPHDIAGYADRIEKLLGDDPLRARFSSAATRAAAAFSTEEISAAYEKVYETQERTSV